MEAAFREETLELSRPLGTADRRIDERRGFLFRVERDGVVGVGEAAPLPGWTEPVAACRDNLERAVERLRENDPDGATEAVEDAPAASHALDLATVDRAARAAGVPLYRHLGDGGERRRVPVNATVGDDRAAETADAVERARDRGFGTVKVKVGARSVSADLERLRAVRKRVGESVGLRVDANGAWSRQKARTAVEGMDEDDLRVSYVEQPVPADDLSGLSSLRGRGVGVAVDETLREYDVERVIAADAADVVVIKPMVHGGPTAAVRSARVALRAGLDPVVTTTVDGAPARTGAVHCAAAIPVRSACGLATADLLARDVGPDPAPVADGSASVPRGPGLAATEVVERWWSG
jgi:o-succinylbenzoate synthase